MILARGTRWCPRRLAAPHGAHWLLLPPPSTIRRCSLPKGALETPLPPSPLPPSRALLTCPHGATCERDTRQCGGDGEAGGGQHRLLPLRPRGLAVPAGPARPSGAGAVNQERPGLASQLGREPSVRVFPTGTAWWGSGGASLPPGPRGARDAVPLQTPPLARGTPGFTGETEARPGKGVCPPSAHSCDASRCPPVFPLPVGHRLQPGLAVTTRRGPAPPERTRHRGGFR